MGSGEKTYKALSALAADDPVAHDTNAKEHDLLPIEGCQRFRNLAKREKHDLSSLASPKGEMKSQFSWTNLFKSPTSSTLCFGEPALGKLKQVKLLCSPTSITLWDPTLAKLYQETELCIPKHIPLCDSAAHTGTPFSVPRSLSETNRVSDCHSSLVATSSLILIEVTKVLIHPVGKNGEHFYGENFIYECPIKRHIKSNEHLCILHAHIKSNQHMGILHVPSTCVK